MKLTVQWNHDAGHEWLAVRIVDCAYLGLLEADFSEYSYKTALHFFLEGDCDAGFFIEAAERSEHSIEWLPEHHDEKEEVRKLDRMNGKSLLWNKRMNERETAKQACL